MFFTTMKEKIMGYTSYSICSPIFPIQLCLDGRFVCSYLMAFLLAAKSTLYTYLSQALNPTGILPRYREKKKTQLEDRGLSVFLQQFPSNRAEWGGRPRIYVNGLPLFVHTVPCKPCCLNFNFEVTKNLITVYSSNRILTRLWSWWS